MEKLTKEQRDKINNGELFTAFGIKSQRGEAMSKVKIQKALEKKGLSTSHLEFVRGDVTPGGYANGWEIELDENSENALFDAEFSGTYEPDCRNVGEVMEWIESLPSCATS